MLKFIVFSFIILSNLCSDFNIYFRLYLNDKDLNIVSYSLLLCVLEYQTAVMRKDFESADKILPNIPLDQRTRVAHFLEKQVRMHYYIMIVE